MKILLCLLLCSCVSLEYKDPDSDATLKYSSVFKSATDVQIIYTSPEKTVAVGIGSTQNDQIIEQTADLVKAQNPLGDG